MAVFCNYAPGVKKTDRLVFSKSNLSLFLCYVAATGPPAWMAGKIMATIKEDAGKGIWTRIRHLHIKFPLQAAATVLIAVTALYIFRMTENEIKIPRRKRTGYYEERDYS